MKMYYQKRIVLPLALGSLAYLLFYYYGLRSSTNGFGFSMIHLFLSFVLLNNALTRIDIARKENRLSISKFTILVVCVYFFISSIKYSEGELAKDFLSDNNIRLFGSFIVFLSIRIAISVEDRLSRRISSKCYSLEWFKPGFYFIVPFFVLFSFFEFNYNYEYYSYTVAYTPDSLGQLLLFIYSSLLYFSIMVVAAGSEKKPLRVIMVVIVMMIPCMRALQTGKRSALMLPILALGYAFILFNKVRIKTLARYISIVPFLFLLLTRVSFLISERVSSVTSEYIAKDIAYRFDLSDFPMSVLSRTNGVFIRLGQLIDGIRVSVPHFLFGGKSDFNTSATEFYESIGLNGSDYTDSFFSMGADAFGYFGFFLFFIVIIAAFVCIEVSFSKKRNYSIVYRFACFPLFTHVESSWIYFIPAVRNTILSLIVMYCVFCIIEKVRLKGYTT